jgi:1-acyl-sn-glycerol-3-phosphate acyltransferase
LELKCREGKENIPSKSGFVMVANHQSFLDINAVFSGVSHTAFLAKADLWKIPYFGWGMSKSGSIPFIEKTRKNAAWENNINSHIDEGFNYCVFPEGNRTKDGR